MLIFIVIIIVNSIIIGTKFSQQKEMVAHKKMIIQSINNLVAQALVYQKKPHIYDGGEGSFVGFKPTNSEDFNQIDEKKLGAVKLSENNVNYFIEYYDNNSLKITASSNKFGEGNYFSNANNARIVAVFNNHGKIDQNGFQISGDW